MRSLRRNLVLGTAAAIVAVFIAVAVVLYLSVRSWLVMEFDQGLLAQAEALAAATELHNGIVKVEEAEEPVQFRGGPDVQYFEIWRGERATSRSVSLGVRDLPLAAVGAKVHVYQPVSLPDGRPGRMIFLTFTPRNEEGENAPPPKVTATIAVARDTTHLMLSLSRLGWLLAGACGAAVAVSAGALTLIIRRALSPVEEIAARIDGVGRRDLSDRLDLIGTPRELLPVVHRLNDMLGRIQTAFERERAFTADVAHELRTPLSGLETALQVAASRPRESQEYQRVLARCLQTTRQMNAMVESLLMLARTEAGVIAISPAEFSLCGLLDECWQSFEERAMHRGLQVNRSCGVEGAIRTDREKLRQILHNLLDNAVSYVDDGGSIRTVVSQTDGQVQIMVTNSGSGLSPEPARQVFDRFWRGDSARAETGAHTGLGLSITKQLVGLLKGTIEVDSALGGDFVARVRIPTDLKGS